MPATINTIILAAAYSSDATKLTLCAAVGAIVGVFLFFRGFRMLQYKRLIINTPSSKIRSASMGLVELTGMTTGSNTIPAGITGEACYYYRATAWQWHQTGNNRGWKQVADERLFVPFFVEDPTGQMLVNPQGADLDLHCNFKDEIGSSFFSSRDMLPENVAQFMMRNGITTSERVRLEEYCIKPGFPLFVLGSLGKNSGRLEWTPSVHVGAMSSSLAHLQFNIAGPLGTSLLRALGGVPGVSVESAAMTAPSWKTYNNTVNGPADSGAVSIKAATAPRASVWSSVSVDEVELASAHAKVDKAIPSFHPSLPDPEELAASVSTSVQEPAGDNEQPPAGEPTQEHPDVVIGKGTRDEPFIISWRSQREVVRSLAWKSTLCIWGGPALTLLSFYVLSLTLGWM